ncbi:hypothetical protein DFH07DRAFT_766237 [Mycena maculata]|uniref:Uncharacterized protein n=1 Tax=Mycena maculata TaxID=230809 RepID=A0AAD7K480_9AGAR|nr:hypothetical protein DFH07DRAFT_766237 [Mycena maculata]
MYESSFRTNGRSRAAIEPDYRPLNAEDAEPEELHQITTCGFNLLSHAWIGAPPVACGAPPSSYHQQEMRDFVDYMVSGRQTDPVTDHRIQTVFQHSLATEYANLVDTEEYGNWLYTRDYDSVLAVSSVCPVKDVGVEMYTLANFKKGLKGTTHMKLRFGINGGGHVAQDPASHITCLLGSFGESSRNAIYLCFPHEEAHIMELRDMQEAIYRAERRAHEVVYPDNAHGYAATFDAEMARAANNNSKVVLPEFGVHDFMEEFQNRLRAEGVWATTHYFIAQIRGVKDNYRHSDNCRDMLNRLVADIDTDNDTTIVYVDVGLEIRPTNLVDSGGVDVSQQWSNLPRNNLEGHLGVMGLNIDDLRRPVKTYFDPWCGIVGIQGFRIDATRQEGGVGPHHAIYGQVYVTDKFGTYHAGYPIQVQPIDVLRMRDGTAAPKVSYRLSDILVNNKQVPVHTRYELRVPLAYAHLALGGQDYDFDDISVEGIDLGDVFVLYETVDVWEYRWLNLVAATWIFQEIAEMNPQDQRASPDALLLAAATAYFVNCICARPSDKSWWRGVATAVFPVDHVRHPNRHYLWDLSATRDTSVPYFEHGRMWLPHIMWPGPLGSNVRFTYARNRILDDTQISKVFGSPRKAIEIRFTLHKGTSMRELGGATRKCKPSPGLLGKNPMVPPAAMDIVFQPNFSHDTRGDIAAQEAHDDRWTGDRHPTILLVETLSQLIQRAGVSQGDTYSRLSETQQRLVGLATFQDPHFCVYWDKVCWKEQPDFRQSFDILLPIAGEPIRYINNQGWQSLTAWRTLMTVREQCPDKWDSWRVIIWTEFQKFKWFFAFDRSKCFEKAKNPSWTTHKYGQGIQPKRFIRIYVSSNPPITRTTRPVLDEQLVEDYIAACAEEEGAGSGDDEPVHPTITAEMLLAQQAPRLQITDRQRAELNHRPGTRVPQHILDMCLEEEEESSD